MAPRATAAPAKRLLLPLLDASGDAAGGCGAAAGATWGVLSGWLSCGGVLDACTRTGARRARCVGGHLGAVGNGVFFLL